MRGLAFRSISNDDVVSPALERLGYSHEDAVHYTIAACWEFIISNVGADVANIAAMSYTKAVDTALHDGIENCETYEEFFSLVKKEIEKEYDRIHSFIRNLWFVPSPFMNVLMDCNIYEGGK